MNGARNYLLGNNHSPLPGSLNSNLVAWEAKMNYFKKASLKEMIITFGSIVIVILIFLYFMGYIPPQQKGSVTPPDPVL